MMTKIIIWYLYKSCPCLTLPSSKNSSLFPPYREANPLHDRIIFTLFLCLQTRYRKKWGKGCTYNSCKTFMFSLTSGLCQILKYDKYQKIQIIPIVWRTLRCRTRINIKPQTECFILMKLYRTYAVPVQSISFPQCCAADPDLGSSAFLTPGSGSWNNILTIPDLRSTVFSESVV